MNLKKELFRNCIPAVVCMVLNGIYTIIDGLFIGQNVGEAGLAAINLVWPVPAVITAAGTAIGTGGGICISLEKGKGNSKETQLIFQSIFILFGAAALFLTFTLRTGMGQILSLLGAAGKVGTLASEYGMVVAAFAVMSILGSGVLPMLRNAGRPVLAMWCMICGLLGNICLNYYFIIIKNLGTEGAAWGTVGAQTLVVILGLGILFLSREKRERRAHITIRKFLRWSKRILYSGVAVFGISLLPTWTLALTNYQCLRFGGTGAVAVYAVISYLVFPVQSMLVGIGDGIQPLVSFYAGKKDSRTVTRMIRMAGWGIAAVAALCLCLVVITAPYTGGLFGLTPERMPDYLWGLKAAAVSFLPYGLSKFQITCMNGQGNGRHAALLIYGEALILAPFLLFILPATAGMKGIWSEPFAAAVVCLTGACLLQKYTRSIYSA